MVHICLCCLVDQVHPAQSHSTILRNFLHLQFHQLFIPFNTCSIGECPKSTLKRDILSCISLSLPLSFAHFLFWSLTYLLLPLSFGRQTMVPAWPYRLVGIERDYAYVLENTIPYYMCSKSDFWESRNLFFFFFYVVSNFLEYSLSKNSHY